jgi:dTDP-4-amino-4,6-dideoxygalactose transaminase
MKVPFVDLKSQYNSIKNQIDSSIKGVLESTGFIGGKYVLDFEENFSRSYNVENVISCANGTDSLYIIMKMLGIKNGDEVITVANSWISSSETITQTGAKPVFVDIDPIFYSINENLIEEKITVKTKAIIAVHLHGQMCEINKINEICKKHNLFLIEDCAQSHFSSLNQVYAGLTGIAASFSFYPGKNLGAYGDAGCIITKDKQLAEKFRMYANHGALIKHQHQMEGINSRMDGIQAAILNTKLPYIKDWTKKRQDAAKLYIKLLSNEKNILLPKVRENSVHSFHLFVIQAESRNSLKSFLHKNGIETAIHYPTPLPMLNAYKYLNHSLNDFPVSNRISTKILSLPIYPEITKEQIEYISEKIINFYKI